MVIELSNVIPDVSLTDEVHTNLQKEVDEVFPGDEYNTYAIKILMQRFLDDMYSDDSPISVNNLPEWYRR